MRNLLIILTLLTALFFNSCKKEEKTSGALGLPSSIQAGQSSSNLTISPLSVLVKGVGHASIYCIPDEYFIDLDEDGTNDFVVQSFYCQNSRCYSTYRSEISCLTSDAKIIMDDTLDNYSSLIWNVKVIAAGDELNANENWQSGRAYLHEYVWFNSGMCYQAPYGRGNWENVSDKYIGLLVNKPLKKSCGWIKVGTSANEVSISEIARGFISLH